MAYFLSVHSRKGGTGKTTLAVAFATLWARCKDLGKERPAGSGRSVLLLDLDMVGSDLYFLARAESVLAVNDIFHFPAEIPPDPRKDAAPTKEATASSDSSSGCTKKPSAPDCRSLDCWGFLEKPLLELLRPEGIFAQSWVLAHVDWLELVEKPQKRGSGRAGKPEPSETDQPKTQETHDQDPRPNEPTTPKAGDGEQEPPPSERIEIPYLPSWSPEVGLFARTQMSAYWAAGYWTSLLVDRLVGFLSLAVERLPEDCLLILDCPPGLSGVSLVALEALRIVAERYRDRKAKKVEVRHLFVSSLWPFDLQNALELQDLRGPVPEARRKKFDSTGLSPEWEEFLQREAAFDEVEKTDLAAHLQVLVNFLPETRIPQVSLKAAVPGIEMGWPESFKKAAKLLGAWAPGSTHSFSYKDLDARSKPFFVPDSPFHLGRAVATRFQIVDNDPYLALSGAAGIRVTPTLTEAGLRFVEPVFRRLFSDALPRPCPGLGPGSRQETPAEAT